jgi:uncharacterized protein (DUF697 family)
MRALKTANLLRVLRDIDLEAIRQRASQPFRLLVLADAAADAERVRELLALDARRVVPAGHPWVTAAGAGGLPPRSSPPAAALLASWTPDFSPALAAAREALSGPGVPVIAIIVGPGGTRASTAQPGEAGRLAVPAIDSAAAPAIASALLAATPRDLHLALARQLPALRDRVFEDVVDETASANASFALATGLAETVPALTVPLNLGDIVILTKNQLVMCYRIALAGGRDGDPSRLIGEILGVLGGGLLFRQVARQLVGLIPVAGLLPKVAVAYGGTWAIGRTMAAWVTDGRAITGETAAGLVREGLARGRETARRMARHAKAGGQQTTRRIDVWRRHLPWIGRRAAAATVSNGRAD